MKNTFKIVAVVLILVISYFSYVLWTWAPQGHGSEANYSYGFSKFELEKKIDSVVNSVPNVSRKELNPPPDDNYYNKDAYFTIIIGGINYSFRYYGDSTDWAEWNNSSEIFIASITDENMNKSDEEYLQIVEDKFIKKLGDYTKKDN